MTASRSTAIYSPAIQNNVVCHWHRELTGAEARQLFDHCEARLVDRFQSDPLHVFLYGGNLNEALAAVELPD
jgi:hypothetical protein